MRMIYYYRPVLEEPGAKWSQTKETKVLRRRRADCLDNVGADKERNMTTTYLAGTLGQ